MLFHTLAAVVAIVIVTNPASVFATDYCNPSLCYGYGKHVGCDNNGDFSSKCPENRFMVNMTNNMKYLILHKHNQLRNIVAMGQVAGYDSADNMAQLSWDNELASLAELNVKTCKFGHDKCFKTDRFPLAGQNLYEIRSSTAFKWNTFPEAIDYFIRLFRQ